MIVSRVATAANVIEGGFVNEWWVSSLYLFLALT